jgi:hypothetical protein
VKLARNRCMLPSAVRLSLSRYCTLQPHPCTVLTAAHHIHTRPPDTVPARLAYQRPLVNTYRMFDLCRPQRARHRLGPRRAFTVTRSGAGIDLPGFGHARSDMSDHEDDAPAARGALGSRARITADRDDDRHRPWRKSDFPSDDAAFERCRVKSHEDFPRHIYRLFLVLGIQFRWVLTCGTLARALVSQADLAIDDAKENAWMALYEHDRDTLEDILYRRLRDLWAPLTYVTLLLKGDTIDERIFRVNLAVRFFPPKDLFTSQMMPTAMALNASSCQTGVLVLTGVRNNIAAAIYHNSDTQTVLQNKLALGAYMGIR